MQPEILLEHVSRVSGVEKIAVLRANAIGDFVVATPALRALRAAYPTAEIVLLGLSWHRDFLTDRPGPVDRVIVIPDYPGVGRPEEYVCNREAVDSFFETTRAENIDLAVQLHGGGCHSNPFVNQLGARVTIGSRTLDSQTLTRSVLYQRYQHEVLRFLEIVALAGAESQGLDCQIAVTVGDREESFHVVPATEKPFVALHVASNDPERIWPPERFARVADRLSQEGAPVVLIGSEADELLARQVQQSMGEEAVSVCGRLSLGGLVGLLSRCSLMVGNDSGPRHLAEAVGTPTVGIFSAFNLINYGPLHQQLHRPVVSWRTSPGSLESVPESYLTDVEVDDVLEPALELLALSQSEGLTRPVVPLSRSTASSAR
jgi:ADP-heptose:LPS heptosyltransferase